MSISEYFEKVGAPLKNTRWSWGAVREADGAVVLRVWQDRKVIEDGTMYMMVTHHEKYVDREASLGYQERLVHVEAVRNGAKCYMVMCKAVDTEASPRKIKSFNSKELFVGGSLIERQGNTYVAVVERVRA